jgi:hypothetical protein
MNPTFSFSPAAKGLAAAANSDVERNSLPATASSNPLRKTSGEPPLRSAVDGLVAVTVVGADDPPLETAVGCGALVDCGTAVGSSLPQAANATMAISMNAPINVLRDCLNMDRFLIRLYKPVPPENYGPFWWPETYKVLDQARFIPNMTRMTVR